MILSTFDKSDDHPLAVSLVAPLWEEGRSHFLQLELGHFFVAMHWKENLLVKLGNPKKETKD